jgi:hypoxanthine-DNA glycosylase
VPTVTCFPPVADSNARVLILGSMPGERSLAAGQYYAHPANAFWTIVGGYCGTSRDAPYADRLRAVRARGIALWDVLQRCERQGSLDADIVVASALPNDFVDFLARHRGIRAVLCNGATSFRLFTQRVAPGLGPRGEQLTVHRLPSTSPAHASLRPAQKRALWLRALAAGLC